MRKEEPPRLRDTARDEPAEGRRSEGGEESVDVGRRIERESEEGP